MFKRKLNESTSDNAHVTKQTKIVRSIILSEEGTLKFDFMISLQNIAMAKIISDFWMDPNTQVEIVNLFRSPIGPEHGEFAEKWLQIESNIVTKVSTLSLPVSVIKNLINIVPVIGISLFNWIKYHDEYVLKTDKASPYSTAYFIGYVIWTARGKIDYAQTAKNILVNNVSSLRDAHKYEIACTYCFVEKINLLSVIVDDRYYLSNVDMELNPMVLFWTAHIRRKNNLYNPYYTLLYNPYNMSIYEYLMWLLINNNRSVKQALNEIPIMYVWNKLNKEERSGCIAPLIRQIGNQDFVYSILSELDYVQQQKVFKECADSILIGILNDWLWKDAFLPIALQILDIMNPLSYFNVLEEVNKMKRMHSKEENEYIYDKFKSILKQLWKNGSSSLKDFLYEHENGHSLAHFVTKSLSWERDMDLVEIILKDLSPNKKRNFIFGSCVINYCSFQIQNDRWDLLDSFIKHNLPREDDVRQLKQRLSLEKIVIAEHFLNHETYDKIEHFMNWSFKSEVEKDEFRRSLVYADIYFNTLESIISNNKVDFTELEKHFKWCAKNDLELLNEFKKEISQCSYAEALIMELITQQKYELLDQMLRWCFSENQKQIAFYRSNMYKGDKLSGTVRSLISTFIMKDKSFKMLDKFTCWSFENEQEIQEFKTWILYPFRTGKDVLLSPCADLLDDHNFELADKFIHWCVTSSEAANTFKNEYMLSNDMLYILSKINKNIQDDLKLIIKWFDPSEETVEKFKLLYLKNDCPYNFFELLDDYVERKKSLITNCSGNTSQDIKLSLNKKQY